MIPSFTAAQRKKIYLQGLEKAEFPKIDEYGCAGEGVCSVLFNTDMVQNKIKYWHSFEQSCTNIFHELELFKESDEDYWLDGTDRYLVLSFCIELTKSIKN